MNAMEETDGTLLRRFAGKADEAAFREIVARHLPMVRGVAARALEGDAHLADDVAQDVFTLLAGRARGLCGHPTVVGWLFSATRKVAANRRRAEVRRNRREQEANMIEENERGESAALWREVRPLLDEGLARLGEGEREVLLLRFGEGAGYAEIAARCGLKENAARMRAERALEKLRAWLSRRGVTSTAAALGTAVGAHAAPAVTLKLVTSVTAQAVAGAVSVGGGASGVVLAVEFMSKAKVLGALAVVAAGVALYEAREVRVQSAATVAWRQRAEAAEAELTTQRAAVAEANRRAQAADEDNARLVAVLSSAPRQAPSQANPARAQDDRTSRAEVTRRFEHAKALAGERRFDEALKEFLWCFEVGMRSMAYFDYRYTEIPAALTKLIENYPAAADVLRERRAELLRRASGDERDLDSVFDFASISKALRDPSAIVDAMNRFPPGDTRRSSLLTNGGYDLLMETRNYTALAKEKPFEKMAADLEFQLTIPAMMARDEKQRAEMIKGTTRQAERDFEVLLGVGDEMHATALAAKILAADGSPETRAALAEKAKRAGRSDWKLPGS